MTTAARPTWPPAKGGTRNFGPSQKYSSRDIASHTTLKPGKKGKKPRRSCRGGTFARNWKNVTGGIFPPRTSPMQKLETAGKGQVRGTFRLKGQRGMWDADDSDVDVKSDNDSDDDNEDDSAALLAELERIKKERAEEKLWKELQQQEEDLKAKEAKLMRGNPLTNINNSSSVLERRRDGDAVFKNQSRDESKIPSGMIFTASFCRNT